jgi:hypothetical protein
MCPINLAEVAVVAVVFSRRLVLEYTRQHQI